jgi:hypothetical protein
VLRQGTITAGAFLSPCRIYRYVLWRRWDAKRPSVMFVGLNPSTADETEDDPTIRRCVGFAKAWGYGGIAMLNLFAYRSTDPAALKRVSDPIGPHNNDHLIIEEVNCAKVIAAWGVHGTLHGRDRQVCAMLTQLWCLGTTKSGHPKHPLYLRSDTQPVSFKNSASLPPARAGGSGVQGG